MRAVLDQLLPPWTRGMALQVKFTGEDGQDEGRKGGPNCPTVQQSNWLLARQLNVASRFWARSGAGGTSWAYIKFLCSQ